MENIVISALKDKIFSTSQIDIITEKIYSYISDNLMTSNAMLNKITKNIESLHGKLSKLLDYSLDGTITDYEYKNKKKEIDMQILALKEERLKYNFSIQNISKENMRV